MSYRQLYRGPKKKPKGPTPPPTPIPRYVADQRKRQADAPLETYAQTRISRGFVHGFIDLAILIVEAFGRFMWWLFKVCLNLAFILGLAGLVIFGLVQLFGYLSS